MVALMLLAVTVAVAKVTTDYEKGTDFSKYRTYAWAEGKGTPLKDPLMQGRLENAINAQLDAKGLSKDESGPDLSVVIHASEEDQKEIVGTSFGYGGWRGWGGGMGTTTATSYTIPYGTLVVDLVDTTDNKLVWRGKASDIVIPSKPEKATKKLNGAVEKMFKKYPPEE